MTVTNPIPTIPSGGPLLSENQLGLLNRKGYFSQAL